MTSGQRQNDLKLILANEYCFLFTYNFLSETDVVLLMIIYVIVTTVYFVDIKCTLQLTSI